MSYYECVYCSEVEETYTEIEDHVKDTHPDKLIEDLFNQLNPYLVSLGIVKEVEG